MYLDLRYRTDLRYLVAMYSAGSIMWLPPKDRIPSEHLYAARDIDEGCFNHPVLVLSADRAQTEVIFLTVRSFPI